VESGTARDPRPLDLPSGGKGVQEEEENIETIHFYGGEYEGDAFFWCLDRSCSMEWGGRIDVLKSETAQAISQLSDSSEFSVVAFGNTTSVWSQIPRKAKAANRFAASAWVSSLYPEGATCLGPAVATTLSIAGISSQEDKQVIVLSDGIPTCSTPAETLSQVASANWESLPIHTVYISGDSDGVAFMQQLAGQNGGTFRHAN